MNIGFVSTWCEQGAAYVTRQYIDLLKDKHQIFVYARDGVHREYDANWDDDFVTWGTKVPGAMSIYWKDFEKWIKRNHIDLIFFNEQQNMDVLADLKKNMPNIITGAYIDYYTRTMIPKHKLYDFLICNTRRHYETFEWHPQCYYVPWGTDTNLFSMKAHEKSDQVIFFHSMGNGLRKGTISLLETFLNTDLCERSKLIIHTQRNLLRENGYDCEELLKKNVEVIEKTVPAPGLYELGDVYVYPAELDGLGLTIYEALSCGMPVIGTDIPPINEPLDEANGRLVKVKKQIAREDGYYWPLSIIDQDSLYQQMDYYINCSMELPALRQQIRERAIKELTWTDRKDMVCKIFEDVKTINLFNAEYLQNYKKKKSLGEKIDWLHGFLSMNIHKRIRRDAR